VVDIIKSSLPPPPPAAEPEGGPPDGWLVQQAVAGCAASFEQLVVRHTPRLLRFLQRRTGSRHDAEDLAQEAWARAFRYLPRCQADRSFPAWLWTIAARLAVSRHRKQALPLAVWSADVAAPGPDAGRQLADAEERAGLWTLATRVLRPAQREALWLFYVEEMSVKEVAQVLEVSTIAAKVLLHRARRRLGAALTQDKDVAPVFSVCPEGVEA
jgi:RNA polymerase sigma-70 factor (ECF subfamily)